MYLWSVFPETHSTDILAVIHDPGCWGFIAKTAKGEPAGFAEISSRKFANGCESSPVPFLEGIWVAPHFRRRGVAVQLIAHVEAFVSVLGFTEIGSDALVENRNAHAAHERWLHRN